MPETVQRADSRQSIQDLKCAFRRFNRRTSALRDTYIELRKEAEQMNLELERKNRLLEEKALELEELSSFQDSILESLPVGVTVTDLGGVIQRCNPVARRIWGIDAGEAVGKSFREVMGRHGDLLEAVLSGECEERTGRRKLERTQKVLNTTVRIVRDGSGSALGAIQLDRDVTHVRKLENQLSRSENMADLGRSAAGVAHEVRKPLNGIKGFASLLKRIADDKSASKYSDRIMDAASRLDTMLNELLDFARPTDLEPQKVDIEETAERVARFVRAEEETANPEVRVEVNVASGAKTVAGDPGKIEQVLLNLVENAVEAVDGAGRVSVTAEPVSEEGNRKVRITVEDDGQGISPDRLESVQQPFTSDKEDGTGLGLAMVNKFLRLHNTELNIESEPGRGTTAEFSLPATEEGVET